MAIKTATDTTAPDAPAPAQLPATPSQGGSYLVDDQTGEHQLVERTQDKPKE